jgi:hypothetical protein
MTISRTTLATLLLAETALPAVAKSDLASRPPRCCDDVS